MAEIIDRAEAESKAGVIYGGQPFEPLTEAEVRDLKSGQWLLLAGHNGARYVCVVGNITDIIRNPREFVHFSFRCTDPSGTAYVGRVTSLGMTEFTSAALLGGTAGA